MKPSRLLLLIVAAACTVGLFTGLIGLVQSRMNTIRDQEKLLETTPFENAPPIVAFTTVALGGFRGLLADYLWLRQVRVQEEGNYFEMAQLASWIVKLQPRFTGAHAFEGWNMAYNISVTFGNYEDRWRWVQRGIEVIRDEALTYNPSDPILYKELAWIYKHKLGQDMDDANRHYKTMFAIEMTKVLATYPPDWDTLAKAPVDESRLRQALDPKTEFWKILAEQKLNFKEFETRFRELGRFPDSFPADRLNDGDRKTLDYCLRSRWLRQKYRLDPERVIRMNQEYGNFDWRLPQAHAIYFARRGLECAPEEKDLNCERLIFQSLSDALKGGRLVYARDIRNFETTPNMDLLDAANQAYLDSMEKHTDNISVRAGYENFLVDAIVQLYTFGRAKKAKEYLEKTRKMFTHQKYRRTVEDFVLAELKEDMDSATYNQAQAAVQNYLLKACFWLACGDSEQAAGHENIATILWQKYMNDIGSSSADRRGLPPVPQMKKNAVDRALKEFPPELAESLRLALGLPAAPPPGQVPAPEGTTTAPAPGPQPQPAPAP